MSDRSDDSSALQKMPWGAPREPRLLSSIRGTTALTAAAVALTLLSWRAQAQPAQTLAASEGEQQLQEVIVTGSYIPRTDTETPSPLRVISSQDIQASGLTTVADVVRSLTADNSGTLPNTFSGAFAIGASGVSLRGLSVNSTLVLIDGLRVAAYPLPDDGIRDFVDLNSIQIGTIDHIEVLQDGASATYGADAIGGVINIILKKSFQGLEVNAAIGNSQHGGGFEKHLDWIAGTGDLATDHYNFYVSAEYQSDNAISVGQRPYPYNDFNYAPFGGVDLRPQPGLNSGSIYGSVAPATLGTPGDVLTGTPVPIPGSVTVDNPTGIAQPTQPLRPCPASAPQTTDGTPSANVFCDQNTAWYDYHQPPTERVGLTARFTTQLNEATRAYLQGQYYQNESNLFFGGPTQIQSTTPNPTTTIALPALIPAPGFAGTPCPGTVPSGNCVLNPNDPFAAMGEAALINYAFGPLGPVDYRIKNHNLRLVGDISGTWAGWNYDGAFVIHHEWLDYQAHGLLNYQQLVYDVTNGTYNFINPSANSQAVLNKLAPPLENFDTSDMDTVVGRVNRPLLSLPGGPLQMALGLEWRYEAEYDPNFNSCACVQALGSSQAIGQRNITSANAELDAPLLSSLEVNVAGRFDHYSDFGNAFDPKVGLKFKPLDAIALRATYSRGFRAPSFAESGASEVESFVNYGACPGSNLCTAHGADGYISSYTLGELTTANPKIEPERSWSYTLGAVLAPLPAFTATFDYYYIKKTNLIGPPNQGNAMSQYADSYTLPPGFSAQYDSLDPAAPMAPPRIVSIIAGYTNAAQEYTDGFDVDLRAKLSLGAFGNFASDLSVTKILSFVFTQAGSTPVQYAGFQSPYNLSSGAGTPQWRANWLNTWSDGPLLVGVNVHYVSGYKEFGDDILPLYSCITADFGQGFTPPGCRVGSFTDIDLTASYQLTDHFSVSGAILNVADIPPPVDTANYAGVNYNPTYSQAGIIGRFFRFGVHYKM